MVTKHGDKIHIFITHMHTGMHMCACTRMHTKKHGMLIHIQRPYFGQAVICVHTHIAARFPTPLLFSSWPFLAADTLVHLHNYNHKWDIFFKSLYWKTQVQYSCLRANFKDKTANLICSEFRKSLKFSWQFIFCKNMVALHKM